MHITDDIFSTFKIRTPGLVGLEIVADHVLLLNMKKSNSNDASDFR
jgi:hypothetical protein